MAKQDEEKEPMLALSRPARVDSDLDRLDSEYRSARWLYHRLLDFEDEHERVLAEAAELSAPGIGRVGRILARLYRREKRAARSSKGTWYPNPHPNWAKQLRAQLDTLRKVRNADPRWKAAVKWADAPEPDAPARGKARRKAGETDEEFLERCSKRRDTASRRESYRKALYAKRHVYHGTWNVLLKSIDQARASVLKRRAKGLPARIRRPKFSHPCSLGAASGGFRILARNVPGEGSGPVWWIVEMRLGNKNPEWVRFRANVRARNGIWKDIVTTNPVTARLTRFRDGERWAYRVSFTFNASKPRACDSEAMVSFDWGHREYGHATWRDGLRVFTWKGDDGRTGEVLLPRRCRDAADQIDALKSRVDKAFNTRKAAQSLPDRNRYNYRRRLMRLGVLNEEETAWLRWEMRYERMMTLRRNRIQNIRKEVYLNIIRELRQRYSIFAFEEESVEQIRGKQKDEQMERRKRSNRDMATRYEFVEMCERHGARIVAVPSRRTTMECPDPACDGLLPENGPELIVVCPKCGTARDKDAGACTVIMRRAKEVLAKAPPTPGPTISL